MHVTLFIYLIDTKKSYGFINIKITIEYINKKFKTKYSYSIKQKCSKYLYYF